MTVAQVAYSTIHFHYTKFECSYYVRIKCILSFGNLRFLLLSQYTSFIFLFSAPPEQFTLAKMFFIMRTSTSLVLVYASVEPLNVICFPLTLQFPLQQQQQHGRGLNVSSHHQHLIWFSIFRLSFPQPV